MKACIKNLFLLPALTAVLGLILSCRTATAQNNGVQYQIPTAEYSALVDLYNSTGGSSWNNQAGWLDPNATSWSGIGISGVQYDTNGNVSVQGNVTVINLQGYGLNGNIPTSIGNFSQLYYLRLSFNQLTGSIPSTIGNLHQLWLLYLHFNNLSGPIPDTLGNLPNLQYLYLRGNNLSGSIPSSLGNLTGLILCGLGQNQLSGTIPSSLGNLTHVTGLDFNNNLLTGGIPSSFVNLSSVEGLQFENNQLSGNIPDIFGNLNNLTGLGLNNNQFSGVLPTSLSTLANLQSLNVASNQLSGNIPLLISPLNNASLGPDPTQFPLGAYFAGNWFPIAPGTQSRSNIDQMVTSGKLIYYTPQNGVSVTPLRVSSFTADVKATDSIDAPIMPVTTPAYLSTASPLGMGVVADDVTPVLFQFNGTATNYTIQITHNATSYNDSLSSHLFVLQNGAWTPTTSLTISSSSTPAYAYLSGLTWADFSGTPANGVTVTLTASVNLGGVATVVASTNVLVVPPPVILVHGYSANASSWSSSFISVLQSGSPAGFVQAINYGTDNNNYFNTTGSLDDLLPTLDTVLTTAENNLRANWAFSRYDVVGHSQGGVLLRMLCQSFPNRPSIVGPNNYYRGRFRRVITIGSPQNGSTLLHYLLDMLNSQNMSAFIPAFVGSYIQPKFDPFGPQIAEINNPNYPIDPRIKFNCIRTTVDDGLPPQPSINTAVENIVGLCQARSDLAGQSVGQLFLVRGYDSIVDFDSQGGGAGTPVTTMPNSAAQPANIAHAALTYVADIAQPFGVSSDHGQTSDVTVAGEVWQLLNGPANDFGPFVLPSPLPSVTRDLIDSLAPKPTIAGTIVGLIHFNIPSTNYYYGLQTTPTLATNAPVSWFVQVFGTNGVSSAGISLLVNSNNTSQVMVSVTSGLVGTAVLYASYTGTNGNLFFANPIVVASYFPGTTLSSIELYPPTANMSAGDVIPTAIWGNYTNGTSTLLYIPIGQAQYSSSNTNVASVDTNGTITMNSAGVATITASYQGFTAQTLVSTIAPFITAQPQNEAAAIGSSVIFSVTAVGMNPLGYQWQFNGNNLTDNGRIFGSQSNVLTVSNLNVGDTGGYSLVITNIMGATNTITALLTVVPPPTITSLTPCQTILEGTNAVFTVTASSLTPVNYQWQFNGTNIARATNSTLTLSVVQSTNDGSYSVAVGNLAGTVTSNTCLSVVTFTASQSSPAYYQSPGTFVVSCQVAYAFDREMYFLVWEPTLPPGWTIANANGNGNPLLSGSEIIFDGPFPSPLNFTYTVNIPAGQSGTQQIFGGGLYFLSGMTDTATAPAVPNPLLANYGTLLSLLLQNGQPQLTLQGNIGSSYRIQSSTNLQTWTDVLTMVPMSGMTHTNLPFPFTNNMMFYRAVSP